VIEYMTTGGSKERPYVPAAAAEGSA
jgi:hypothetical protein